MTDNSPQLPSEINEQQSAAIYGGQPQPDNTPSAATQPTAPAPQPAGYNLEALIAEAEQRGYLRGRNEAAEEMMSRPAMWQPVEPPASVPERITAAADSFLSGLRPGVWDGM